LLSFGLSASMTYIYALFVLVTVIYVSVGGMMATTWEQIIKAVLMLLDITLLAIGTMHQFDYSFSRMYREVAEYYPLLSVRTLFLTLNVKR